jgi:hypothetical protein
LALAGLLAAVPGQAAERILLFVSDVRVERDASLSVTETIRVQAEGREIRRGILRDFPTDYRRRDGTRVQVGFEVLSVTRGGAAEPFATERLANGVRVRIGSADRLIGRGVHDYVIRYRATRQIGFFPDFDELYWNATGTGWTFPWRRRASRCPNRSRSGNRPSTPGRKARPRATRASSGRSRARSSSAPPRRSRRAKASRWRRPGRRASLSRRARRRRRRGGCATTFRTPSPGSGSLSPLPITALPG